MSEPEAEIIKKRGALSDEDKVIIRSLCKELTIDEIARTINRTTEPVIKYMAENKLSSKEMDNLSYERIAMRYRLRARPYYYELEKQLMKDELVYFEDSWIRYLEQFNNDITHSEELQVKEAIVIQILISRTLAEKKDQLDEITRLQGQLSKELALDDDMRDVSRVLSLESSLASARAALAAYTGEYSKLLDKLKDINRDLKITRDQRKKHVEDNKGTWASLMKQLEDEEFSRRTGEHIEVMKVAKDRAKQMLSEPHLYADGKIDIPILTPETIARQLLKQHQHDLKEEKDE